MEAVVGNLQHAIPPHSINDLCKVLLFWSPLNDLLKSAHPDITKRFDERVQAKP